ncbi:MAG: transposase, partial [Boseongicola sp.]|nr:transposase [Boseongicola sp.]
KMGGVVDARGCLSRIASLPRRAHDLAGAPALLEDLRFGAFIGDKAFDSDWLLEEVEGRGAALLVPLKRSRAASRDHDREMYMWRHQVENLFARIKEFRAVAMRNDKCEESFAAGIHLVAGVIAAT